MKKGTTTSAGKMAMKQSHSGVRHGPNHKNVVKGGRSAGRPSAPTSPIKGQDRGGV